MSKTKKFNLPADYVFPDNSQELLEQAPNQKQAPLWGLIKPDVLTFYDTEEGKALLTSFNGHHVQGSSAADKFRTAFEVRALTQARGVNVEQYNDNDMAKAVGVVRRQLGIGGNQLLKIAKGE